MSYLALAAFIMAGLAIIGFFGLWDYFHNDHGYQETLRRQISTEIQVQLAKLERKQRYQRPGQ